MNLLTAKEKSIVNYAVNNIANINLDNLTTMCFHVLNVKTGLTSPLTILRKSSVKLIEKIKKAHGNANCVPHNYVLPTSKILLSHSSQELKETRNQ